MGSEARGSSKVILVVVVMEVFHAQAKATRILLWKKHTGLGQGRTGQGIARSPLLTFCVCLSTIFLPPFFFFFFFFLSYRWMGR